MLGVTAILVAGSELAGRRIPPLHCDRNAKELDAGRFAALGSEEWSGTRFGYHYANRILALVCSPSQRHGLRSTRRGRIILRQLRRDSRLGCVGHYLWLQESHVEKLATMAC